LGYAKIFTAGNVMSACSRWNEKDTEDKTWANSKVHFVASHCQQKQMQGGSAANSIHNAANAAVDQTEHPMAEANIGALVNIATATATDRGVVATLTEANYRLAKQLEDLSNKLKDIKALLKKERAEKGADNFQPFYRKLLLDSWIQGGQ
jgi:hypothetical protein